MSWRTVVISRICKLDYKMGYMVIRSEDTKRILLDEISVLILENTAISITGCLLAELTAKKIRVVFCDEKRNPSAELVPLYGCHDCSAKIKKQMSWTDELKGYIWTEIVSEKIRKQAELLNEIGKTDEAEMLKDYIISIEFNDATNREGHAAKVYFNALFGLEFTRSADCVTNAALNYGYSIILSAFNREVTANGYLTQLGLFHDNMFNFFNLSCDMMEPFRVLVDRKIKAEDYALLGPEEKHSIVSLLNDTVEIDGNKHTVLNAIKLYCRSVFEALNDGDASEIKFYRI